MTREIKFRIWDKRLKQMNLTDKASFHQGQAVKFDFMIPWRDKIFADEWVIMQYTGLKDRNGKEIYEGDILIDDEYPEEGIGYAKVEWKNAGWIADPWFGTEEFAEEAKDYEVIGNIHENPDLLPVHSNK